MAHLAFSTDYHTARTHFLNVARGISNAMIDSISHPGRGPSGEALTTDMVWIGPKDATKVFVSASGTHGIEGFCGSGAQIDWLERREDKRLAADSAALLIHAVNPYGFAWRRRVTHENVDLNRNWVDFATAGVRNKDYAEIADALCPAEWTTESRQHTQAVLNEYAAKHGFAKLVQTISGGQHTHPDGLFYGGTEPTAARLTLTRILIERLSQAERIAIIDYHSGLGPSGFGELIVAALAGSEAFERARQWYGASIQPIGSQGADFAKISGDWLSAVPSLLPLATVTGVALEFGTVSALEVLDALRADNWLHSHGDPQGPAAEAIKAQILKVFYTDTDVWRGMVLGQSLCASRQAIAGLAL